MQTWDKHPSGETNKAYNAFLVYKNLGASRSLRKAAEIFYGGTNFTDTSPKLRQFKTWSAKHNWVARCSDWDIEEERIRIEQKRKDIMEMDRRQAKAGMEMSKIGMMSIKLHATDDPPLNKDGDPIKPKIPIAESTRLFTEGVKAERIARGEVTEIREHKGEIKNVLEVRYEKDIKAQKGEDEGD